MASSGLHVTVVDQSDPKTTFASSKDGRAYAVSYGSANIFRTIGLWSLLEPHAEPILDIQISDHQSPWVLDYDHQEVGTPMGYMIEAQRLRKTLYNYAIAFNNIEWCAPDQLYILERTPDFVKAVLDDGREIKASLCVAADGRNSQMRKEAGIKITQWAYPQTAIVCQIEHDKPHCGRAYEHFLPSGPFAILPLQGQRASIVWTERSEIAGTFLDLPDDLFNHELQKRFGDDLGEMRVISQRWSYQLGVLIAQDYIDRRLALVGDAAHVIHPVAGQGLNMGFRDIAALAEVILDAQRLGLDIGGATVLERYQRWRRFDNTVLMGVTDGLVRLFSNHSKSLKLFRGFGLRLVSRLPPAKRFLMRHAMGLVGELPRSIAGDSL